MEGGTILQIAIIGQGVIGISSALAIKEALPSAQLTIIGDCDFKDTCSYGPPGLWGPHYEHDENRKWGEISFHRFAKLEKEFSPEITGVKLVSGYLESDNKEDIQREERLVSRLAYNFKWLTQKEMNLLFSNQGRFACHYTSYAAEGRRYVPWMVEQLKGYENISFKTLKINSIQDFVNSKEGSHFDVLINCAGLQGGKLAGDDDSVFPIRGVLFEVDLPWHKHFRLYNLRQNDGPISTYVIPMVNSVLMGGHFQENRWELQITDKDRKEIWQRNVDLQPAIKYSEKKIVSEWCGLRPARPRVRLEHCVYDKLSCERTHVIHNYGHGSNGFTLGCYHFVSLEDYTTEWSKKLHHILTSCQAKIFQYLQPVESYRFHQLTN